MDFDNVCCETFEEWLSSPHLPLSVQEPEGDVFGNFFALKYNFYTVRVRPLYFCPWCGREFKQSFLVKLRHRLSELGVKGAFLHAFDFETEMPEALQYLKDHFWWNEYVVSCRQQHKTGEKHRCDLFDRDVDECHLLMYYPNIQTYGLQRQTFFDPNKYDIANKRECCDFEPINYCYFCGAKLPDRLDEKLTNILQQKYGLESWKDYKKSPAEYHTDEWWKKLGL